MAEKTALKGARLIPCNGNVIDNSLLLIENGIITYAGEMQGFDSGEYQVWDLSGMTVMPGMTEAHVHLSGTRSSNPLDWIAESNSYEMIIAYSQAKTLLV